jgi:hypothetical protein
MCGFDILYYVAVALLKTLQSTFTLDWTGRRAGY